jgi:hypothetical protein
VRHLGIHWATTMCKTMKEVSGLEWLLCVGPSYAEGARAIST